MYNVSLTDIQGAYYSKKQDSMQANANILIICIKG